jgi:hypothetical protein
MTMEMPVSPLNEHPAVSVAALAGLIAAVQQPSGEIPWSPGDKTDPWDHIEAAMGLQVGGYLAEALHAFRWLARAQLPDGSWYQSYRNGRPHQRAREAHHAAYIAVGLYHHYLVTGDRGLLHEMWPSLCAAIDFALGLQAPGGEVHWAVSPAGKVDRMALLTGSSSIFMSLKCALAVARLLGCARPDWRGALEHLGEAIRRRPHHFNMAKSRFSMDWFYPVLAGAVTGAAAENRIRRSWKKFIVQGQGVRCVSDQPWVTIAETCELVLALAAIGRRDLAGMIYGWIGGKRYPDGAFWCGFTFPEMVVWPAEKVTWTQAVALLAADALFDLTPGGRLFDHRLWARVGVSWRPDRGPRGGA